MKALYIIVLAILAQNVVANADCNTQEMFVQPASGSSLVVLGQSASQEVFKFATTAQIGTVFNLGNSTETQSILTNDMACCRIAKKGVVQPSSERCVIAIDTNANRATVSASFLK